MAQIDITKTANGPGIWFLLNTEQSPDEIAYESSSETGRRQGRQAQLSQAQQRLDKKRAKLPSFLFAKYFLLC
jgi:hypothetical protein